MTFEEFHEEVIMSLGGSLVDVELDEKDTLLAFKKAKRTFQQKGNDSYSRSFYKVPVKKGQQCYNIPPTIHTVVKVIRPTFGIMTEDPFSMATFNEIFGWSNNAINTGDWLSYDLTLQLMEVWKRYIAFDIQFHHDKQGNKIEFLKPPERDMGWIIECYHTLKDEDYMDLLWVQSWAVAEAKGMLGSAYRKFQNIPGPDGSTSLDGNSLIQESQREKEMLLEDIANGVDGSSDSAWEVYLV